jgi:hypothetical protein
LQPIGSDFALIVKLGMITEPARLTYSPLDALERALLRQIANSDITS